MADPRTSPNQINYLEPLEYVKDGGEESHFRQHIKVPRMTRKEHSGLQFFICEIRAFWHSPNDAAKRVTVRRRLCKADRLTNERRVCYNENVRIIFYIGLV